MSDKVIVVDHTETNEFGDLIVTDKSGATHKVKAKREELFPLFVAGRAVKLGMAEYKGFAYIASATSVELPEAETPASITTPVAKPNKVEPAPQEIGMWYKEVGECWRVGKITEQTARGKLRIIAYLTRMDTVIGITEVKEEK